VTAARAHRRYGLAVVAGVLGALLTILAGLGRALDVPALTARVNDLTGVLPPAARERLETKLRDLEARTGAQVAVLIVPSLQGDALEDYTVRVANAWKLGRKGVDDGALFFAATNDRAMRIEIGYGLEARLTDAAARNILDTLVRPRFRQGDFEGGIGAAVDGIAAAIAGQPLPAPPPSRAATTPRPPLGLLLVSIPLFVILIGILSFIALLATGPAGWFLYIFLMLFYAMFPTALFPPYGGVVACGAWIVAYPILRLWLRPGAKDFHKRHPWLAGPARAGGPGGGVGGGRWGGGSSGGGGGFSGGGGSFGGGGASSNW
jgi:uncharacterized protein